MSDEQPIEPTDTKTSDQCKTLAELVEHLRSQPNGLLSTHQFATAIDLLVKTLQPDV
jgi:hypothetical protein